jgi:hypothetical protein
MNNLNEILNFIKKNNNYSDFNNINNYFNNLNFTNYKGGAGDPIMENGILVDPETKKPLNPQPTDPSAQIAFQPDLTAQIVPQPDPSAQIVPQPDPSAQIVPQPDLTAQVVPQPDLAAQVVPQPDLAAQVVPQLDLAAQVVPQQAAQIAPQQAAQIAPQQVIQQQEPVAQIVPQVAQQQNPAPQPDLTAQAAPQPDQSLPKASSDVTSLNSDPNCITTSIKDEFGTTIERITCQNRNIVMPNLLIRPTIINSQINTYTIKRGTILYHASKISGFNPREIKLGKDNLISFFTPNFKLASFKVKGCDIDELNSFIHTFEVAKDIENIFIKLPYTTGNINLNDLKNQFCTDQIYNGVGFFFPKNDIELFNNVLVDGNTLDLDKRQNDESYYSEFALCNPNEWLKYIVSHSCKSYRSLSPAFRMNS